MQSTVVSSPAKVNLFLAVIGRRPDGFHNLVSLAAPVAFGDQLRIELNPEGGPDTLVCDCPEVPTDRGNLIMKAAALFRAQHAFPEGICFQLKKRIPLNAGLGGGSSNATAALRGLNMCLGSPLSPEVLAGIAADVGSDCSLFLENAPVLVRGRGERVTPLSESVIARLRGMRLLLFKPDFGIHTAWAYHQLCVLGREAYLSSQRAEALLESWIKEGVQTPGGLYNSFEHEVFKKYLSLPVLVNQIREVFGLRCLMSGSGSTCFAILDRDTPVEALRRVITEAWGMELFMVETSVL